MAKLYANRPVVTVPSDNTSSQPDDSVIVWQNAATGTAPIPSGFTLETITNYLSEVSSNLSVQDEDELVNSGTQKPVVLLMPPSLILYNPCFLLCQFCPAFYVSPMQ